MRKKRSSTTLYQFCFKWMLMMTIISLGLFGGSVPPAQAWLSRLPLSKSLAGATPVSAAADAEWTQEGHDAQRTGYTAEEPQQPWSLAWTWDGPDANGGTGSHFYNAPAEAHTVTGGNFVYVPAGSQGLYALNKTSGSQGWRVTAAAFNATPAYDPNSGSLFAGGSDGKLYKIDSGSGQVQGTFSAGSGINKAVLLVGSGAFVTTDNGDLIKVNTGNMSQAWKYSAGSASATPAAYSASAGVLVYATEDLYVHAVRESDGGGQWRVKPTSHDAGAPYTFSGFWPVIAEQHGIVFVRMTMGFDALWAAGGSGIYPSSNAETRALLQANNGTLENLFALDLASGSKKFIPAVGYGAVELRKAGSTDPFLVSPPVPVVRVNSDGSEVAYIAFRSGQGDVPDGRWDSHMGEMVLDNNTISGLSAGDLRFVDFPNSFVHITDEQTPFTMAGNVLFHAHWGASESIRISDRSGGKGLSHDNPITAQGLPPVVRRVDPCSDFNAATHQTSCGVSLYGDGRYWGGPLFWTYWNTYDPPFTASGAYSDGQKPRYTYVSSGLMVVEGNGGELMVFRSGSSTPAPTPTKSANVTATSAPASTSIPGTTSEWVFCANEYGTCTFSGTTQVRYGAGTSFNYLTATDSIACSNEVFGDPAFNQAKSCYYQKQSTLATSTKAPVQPTPTKTATQNPAATITPTPPETGMWVSCANEGGTCTFSGTYQVRYGAGTSFNYLTATNSIACTNAVFGDPAPGQVKSCYYLRPNGTSPTSTPTQAATATRIPPTATKVPTNAPTATRVPPTATQAASTSTQAASGTWTFCANENGSCSFSGAAQVRYGANGTYNTLTATSSIACTNAVFGDPLPGSVKTCEYLKTTSVPTATKAVTPTRTPTRTNVPTITRTPTRTKAPTSTRTPTKGPTATRTPTKPATSAPTATRAPATATTAPTTAFTATPSQSGTWMNCASEGGTCTFSGTTQVRYGANGTYNTLTATNSIACTNAVFGDPVPGTAKSCAYLSGGSAPTATKASTTAPTATRTPTRAPTSAPTSAPTATPASSTWVTCASEGGTCSFSGTAQVRYGANGTYSTLTATNSITCTNAVFGDPVPGVAKTCAYLSGAAAPTAAPTLAPTAVPTTNPNNPGQPTPVPGTGRISNVKIASGSPSVYEKFEVQFNVQTSATNLDLPYDTNTPAGMPAGTGITVNGLFSNDGWKTTITQPAFIYQPYTTSVSENRDHFTPAGGPVWAVRFAPQQAGNWQYRLSVQDSQGQVIYPATSQPALTFSVGSSSISPYLRKGFLGVSQTDQRYFQFKDGSPFVGVGFNDGYVQNPSTTIDAKMASFEQNKMNFFRVWMSGSGINGSQWPAWASSFLPNDAYLPGVSFDTANTYNGGLVSLRLDNANPCLYADFWRGGVSVEPNTTYTVTARVKTSNVTGSGDYGFVVKQGGWLDQTCDDAGTGKRITAPVKGSTDWTVVSGTYTTGSSEAWMGNLYLARENASGGNVYIDEVHLYRADDPNKVDLLRQPYANPTEHYDDLSAAQWDLYIQAAEKHGVYLKLVVDEKNEWIRNRMGADGKLSASSDNNNFYAAPGTKVRWLEQAWWRYIIARWGYSTAIHSFEYINEGDPYNGNHYEAAEAMAKYFKQNDPSRHMVTTSFWASFPNAEFWSNAQFPDVDYTDLHAYISTGWGDDASFLPKAMQETNTANVHSGKGSARIAGNTNSSTSVVPRGVVIQGQGEWVIKYWMKASGLTATCNYNTTGSQMRVRWQLDGGTYNGGREGVIPANSEAKDFVCTSPSGTFDWKQFSSTSDRDGNALPSTARIIVNDNNPHALNVLLENSSGTGGTAWIDDVQIINPSGQVQPVLGTFETTLLKEDTAWSNIAYGQIFGAGSLVGARKPMVRGETGLDDGVTYDPDQVKDTKGIWLHNNVWAQMNSGGMYDLFWWSTETIPSSIYPNFLTYQNFMAGIPLSNGRYRDVQAATSHPDLRVVGQRDDTAGQMHLWIQNTQHSWRRAVNGPAVSAVNGTITIPGVTSGSYKVEWWNTYNTTNPVVKTETVSANGSLTLTLPSALADDIAVKISKN